jgi:branched-chain amino acid transport system ATP-binding protein/branched-chain amino acid transport system permease protein
VTEVADRLPARPKTAGPLIEVHDVVVRFGDVRALDSVSFSIAPGERMSLIGPNGAGKTTMVNAISGFVRPVQGSMRGFGPPPVDLMKTRVHRRVDLGIARTFQSSQLFGDLRVIDQVMFGGFAATRTRALGGLFRTPAFLREDERLRGDAMTVLEALDLAGSWRKRVSELPSGHRKLVDLARALISRPKLLMLDEIAAGSSAAEKSALLELIDRRRRADGFALIVIEHDLEFIRAIAETAVVLAHGRRIAAGDIDSVLASEAVLEAYVGRERE